MVGRVLRQIVWVEGSGTVSQFRLRVKGERRQSLEGDTFRV